MEGTERERQREIKRERESNPHSQKKERKSNKHETLCQALEGCVTDYDQSTTTTTTRTIHYEKNKNKMAA